MPDGQVDKFTWNRDDVEWEYVKDPSAKPLIAPDQADAAREALRKLRNEPSEE